MPVDWSRYPTNWKDVRERILDRADHCCERCGAPDRRVIVRDDPTDPAAWRTAEMGELRDDDGTPPTLVILTIAHLGVPHLDGRPGDKHDTMDVRESNLARLCQRCHLLEDMDDHVRAAAETRRQRQRTAGQRELFGGAR